MLPKDTKWYFLIGSVLVVLLCAFGCVTAASKYIVKASEYNKKYPSVQSPIRTLSIRINEDQREELFDQMRKYSEKHGLEFYLSFYNNKETFYIVMYGEGVVIRSLSQPTFTSNLNFRFFENDPTDPPTQETVDELFSDLKSFLNEIPNVTITEEK